MPNYKTDFEATAFTDDRSVLDSTLSGPQAKAFSKICQEEGLFPPGVVSILEARISEDDGQDDNDIHCFVCVDLELAVDSEKQAECFDPPVALLTRIAEHIVGDLGIDLERDSWEAVATEVIRPASKSRSGKPKA